MAVSSALLMTSKPTLVELSELDRGGAINARTRAKPVDDLKSSISSVGLILPLSVRKVKGGYEVIDGNRRLEALRQLHAEGMEIGKVPVLIRKDGDAEAHEASLAANLIRMPLDELEACEAFAKMLGDGLSEEKVARTFNIPVKVVRQRLALGQLHPRAKSLLEQDELEIDAAEHLATLSSDEQEFVLDKARETGHYSNWLIRNLTDKQRVRSNSSLAQFVGADAYKKAGGQEVVDLFGEDNYWTDGNLVRELAEAKVKQLTDDLLAEGWGWVKRGEQTQNYRFKFSRMPPHRLDYEWPEDELAVLDAKRKLDELYDLEDADEDEMQTLNNTVVELQRLATPQWDAAFMAKAGVFIDLTSPEMISKGWYDEKDFAAPQHDEDGVVVEDAPAVEKEPEGAGYSASLVQDLDHEMTAAMALTLPTKPNLAYDLMLATLIGSMMNYRESFGLSATKFIYGEEKGGARSKLNNMREQTFARFRGKKCFEIYAEIREMDADSKAFYLSMIMASVMMPMRAGDPVRTLLWADVREHWTPDEEFFSRLKKSQILEALLEAGVPQFDVQNMSSCTKQQLVQYAVKKIKPTDWRPKHMRQTLG